MVRGLSIRPLIRLARRYRWDGASALLLAASMAMGGAPALNGIAHLLQAPAMAATQRGDGAARLSLDGFPPARFAPQLLYPVSNHAPVAWPLPAAAATSARLVPPAQAVIAICIDDLGEDIAGTDRAMALPAAVAMSFLPFAQTTPFLAVEAGRKGHEILAHVPMEALGTIDPGPMVLKVGASDIAGRLAWNLDRVPNIIGFNNHEGSKFTADADGMVAVAKAAAARHLFFFDSRTSAATQGVGIVRSFGAVSAGRDVFLDDDQNEAEIRRQLARLVAVAQRQGVAIAIGHPHDATLRVLAAWLAQNHGVTLVPLSEAIRLKTARDTQFAAK